VWVTHGVPLSAANLSGSSVRYEWFLQRLAAVLGQAEIAGYAVAQSAESRLPDTMYSLSALETLRLFADLTGGRMYPTDHIDEALIQALADAQLSYRVGYQPPSGKADTEYRKLRVVCLRHGIQVQSRQGYYPNWGVPRRP
jgi:VWFA-related protein